LTVSIFDLHVSFVHASEFERSKVDIPDAIVDFFQSDILAGADAGDIDPIASPADAAISGRGDR
jgi:hypothetical protein